MPNLRETRGPVYTAASSSPPIPRPRQSVVDRDRAESATTASPVRHLMCQSRRFRRRMCLPPRQATGLRPRQPASARPLRGLAATLVSPDAIKQRPRVPATSLCRTRANRDALPSPPACLIGRRCHCQVLTGEGPQRGSFFFSLPACWGGWGWGSLIFAGGIPHGK